MGKIKEYWLLILAYLTMSAGIYHIAYWSTFGINGLAFLDLTDFIKSFVYPLTSLFGLSIYSLLMGYLSGVNGSSDNGRISEKGKSIEFYIKLILAHIAAKAALNVKVC